LFHDFLVLGLYRVQASIFFVVSQETSPITTLLECVALRSVATYWNEKYIPHHTLFNVQSVKTTEVLVY